MVPRIATKKSISENPRAVKHPEPSCNGDGHTLHEAPDDPHRLARLYLDSERRCNRNTIVRWRGEFHRWDGTAYVPTQDDQVCGYLTAAIKREFDRLATQDLAAWSSDQPKDAKGRPLPKPCCRKVTTNLTANVVQALASMTLLPDSTSQPSWLGAKTPVTMLPAR